MQHCCSVEQMVEMIQRIWSRPPDEEDEEENEEE